MRFEPTSGDPDFTTEPFEWPSSISTYQYTVSGSCPGGLTVVFSISAVFEKSGGGGGGGTCPIANAIYGTELAGLVQSLRETRDTVILQTESGRTFLDTVHMYYYAAGPTIVDWQEKYPLFKELFRLGITPALATTSILNHVEPNSEPELVFYMISTILMNVGLYFVAPAIILTKVISKLR